MRGQGRIYQRKYRDKRTGEGKMQRETATTYGEAMRVLKRRQGEIVQGRRVNPAGERVTFDQLAANLVNDYMANRRRSLERVEDAIAHLTMAFSGYRAREISSDMVTKYVVERQAEGAANGTVNREQAALKRMYRLAVEKLGGYCPTIRMLEEDNVRRGFFERPAFEAVLAGLPDELKPAILAAYIMG